MKYTSPADQIAAAIDKPQDNVNHPYHYEAYTLETIVAIAGQSTPDEFRGFCKGNVMKYLARYRNKNGLEDLEKAAWYLDRLADFERGCTEVRP